VACALPKAGSHRLGKAGTAAVTVKGGGGYAIALVQIASSSRISDAGAGIAVVNVIEFNIFARRTGNGQR